MSSEWLSTTIGEQATLQRGFDITKAEQRDGLIPVISSGGTNSYHDTAMVGGPGVVLGRKGVVGSVYFVEGDYWPHDTTLWVKDFHGNNPRFVYYFFLSRAKDLAALDVGSANPTLNRNHVHPARIVWPSLEEQQEIATLLGALDDRISLLRETNATLEAIAQAMFKSWFVNFDPVCAKQEGRAPEGMDDATAALFPNGFQESELGMVPHGWKVGSLLDIAQLLSGGTPKTDRSDYWGGEIGWASAKDVSQSDGSVLIQTERTITRRGLDESSTRMIPPLATVVVARGATTGRMVFLGRELAMNQTCYALASRIGTPLALYCQLRRSIGLLVNAAHGSVFDTITTKTFAQSKVILPDPLLVEKFEKLIRPLFEKVVEGAATVNTLVSLRDTLLPRLISGQLRLSEAERLAA